MSDEKLTLRQQLALCQHIARLTQARLPLMDHLVRTEQSDSTDLSRAGLQVQGSLSQGKSLQEALVQDDSVDSRILSACLEVGQSSNCLDQTLERWTAMHLANHRAKLAMRSALLYPLTLIAITLIAVGWTAWHLTPDIQAAYLQYESKPPLWLDLIFRMRDYFAVTATLAVMMVTSPLLYWRWRRIDKFGVPRNSAKRFRLQSLASHLAELQLVAGRPLSEALPLCLAAMGTSQQQSHKAFQDLRLHRPLASMPIETTMVLASLHCGIVTRDQAVTHCRQIGLRLEEQANLVEQQECRWLPVLVALVIGVVTLGAYGLLVYLPWVGLMTKIGFP